MRILRVGVTLLSIISVALMALFFVLDRNKTNGPVIHCTEAETISAPTNVTDEELLNYVTATDQEDGNLSAHIVVERKMYFVEPSVTLVTFSVCDSERNVTKLQRKLRFTDYQPPQILLNDGLILPTGSPVNLLKLVSATDVYDGDLSSRIKIISSQYNSHAPGEYNVNFKVTNSFGDTTSCSLPIIITDADYSQIRIRLTKYLETVPVGTTPDFSAYIKDVINTEPHNYTVEDITIDTSEYAPDEPGVYSIYYSIMAAQTEPVTMNRLIVLVEGE